MFSFRILAQAYTDFAAAAPSPGATGTLQAGWAIIRPPAGIQIIRNDTMRATAQAQPNIALIKYWGKRDAGSNLPAVSSLSLTLDTLWTRMTVEFDAALDNDRLELNGETASGMLPRVSQCLDLVAGGNRSRATVTSECNFPVAAGLASSASAFAALVVAASNAAEKRADTLTLARLAGAISGSAARSLYPGIVLLTAGDDDIFVETIGSDWPLELVVAVTDESTKSVGSGVAMLRSAGTSPFYAGWIGHQEQDIADALGAIRSKDFSALAAVAEHNCLKMHSLMWTSKPPVVYWNQSTLACMQTVRKLQADGVDVFFTIDAGPQLKAVCLADATDEVLSALEQTSGVGRILRSGLGAGSRSITRS
ncbi:MAG TPA: diphosphomevalonate decarboxylase [Woeseiaceae bacterium]